MLQRKFAQLPVKSFTIAPGEVIGEGEGEKLIYMANKPSGVEDGCVAISMQNPHYRAYIAAQLAILTTGTHPNLALQNRYNDLIHQTPQFQSMSENQKIDILLQDTIRIKHRYPLTATDLRKIFFSFGKFHEVKAFQAYYENQGMGGLLFEQCKTDAGITPQMSIWPQIGKLNHKIKEVFMVKQDGKMVLGRTGPGTDRLLKTEVGQKFQILANPFLVIATAGISLIGFGVLTLGWKAALLARNTIDTANSDAIVETLGTKIANIRGFTSQKIETIQGTYKNGEPKIGTIVTLFPGCQDLSGKLEGGQSNHTNVVTQWDSNGIAIHIDENNNIIRTQENNTDQYEKITPDGKIEAATPEEYHTAKSVSADNIKGLGEALISCICLGDRDGIGEIGQNKVILPLDPPDGNYQYQFYGIDFGKAYENENTIVNSLTDDFYFDNPTERKKRFLNISILYDNPLSEKMKGIYLMAVLRNKLTDEDKEAIAQDFENRGDKVFADKLRSYPVSLALEYGAETGRTLSEHSQALLKEQGTKADELKMWVRNGDLWLIKKEENTYRQLAKDSTDKQKKSHYLAYADRLNEVYNIANATDKKVLAVFEKRLFLPPSQIDLLENIEKLTAKKVTVLSPDGNVLLNHLKVEPADRIPWQLEKKGEGYVLHCEATQDLGTIQDKLRSVNLNILNAVVVSKSDNRLSISLTPEAIEMLSTQLTEDKVAATRKVTNYRTKAQRDNLHTRFNVNKQELNTLSPPIELEPPTTRPKAVTSMKNYQTKNDNKNTAVLSMDTHHPITKIQADLKAHNIDKWVSVTEEKSNIAFYTQQSLHAEQLEQLCIIAIENAGKDKTIHVSESNPHADAVYAALQKALTLAIEKKQYTQENAPQIKREAPVSEVKFKFDS